MATLNVIQTQEGSLVLNYKGEVVSESIKFEVYGTGTKSEMTRAVWAQATLLSPHNLRFQGVECAGIDDSYAIIYAKYK